MTTFVEEVRHLHDAVEIYLEQAKSTLEHAAVNNIRHPNTDSMDTHRKKILHFAKSVRDMANHLRRKTKHDKDLVDHFKFIIKQSQEILDITTRYPDRLQKLTIDIVSETQKIASFLKGLTKSIGE